MPSDQEDFPGGIYFERSDEGPRADISIRESGTGTKDNPVSMELSIVSGCAVMTLTGVMPEDLKRLGEWIFHRARDCRNRQRQLKDL